jgi:hypothetical protein
MDSPTRSIVRRALDELKPHLATYVGQALATTRGVRRPERNDISALLGAMLDNWEAAFARDLSPTVRHYAHELRDVRNRWAHEELFTPDDARRAADTARLVAKAIGAPNNVLDTLAALMGEQPNGAETAGESQLERQQRADSPASSRAAVRREAAGIIINAAELTADDVVSQRVRCPACDDKVFDTWPLGWDAHAAHVCRGLHATTETERKANYRSRFAHLFRDAGAGAAPSRQRDVMRHIYARYAADEEKAIREYAAAERRGEVARARNTYGITAEDYARRLLADGLAKGWLQKGYE